MRIIISESKLEKMKQTISKKVMEDGIYNTARMMGMDTIGFMDRFGFQLEDKRITDLIDFYMENKFHKVYDFDKKIGMCDLYETPSQFLIVVTEAINEFCYYNFNFTSHYNIDEEDMEFENIFYQMEHYLIKNYGELITNTFIKNCGE
jgi:hypothetical protein